MIISALFLKDTLEASNSESDRVVAEMQHKRAALMSKLSDFFRVADQSGDGLVDRDEIEEMLKNPKVRMWLQSLDLQVHEYVALFKLIDNGSGFICFAEFMTGVQRLKGHARSIDMIGVALDVTRLKHRVKQMHKDMLNITIQQTIQTNSSTREMKLKILTQRSPDCYSRVVRPSG